ncbi:hypothetical protein M422DRAFT_33035 [Sphaerobolus stellatus SS14]|uniref:Uncharacterized protein n=1 Tax=Sphaerobolus stellatus (strain SS14) TaxID=990650 RepID=A0A0C9VM80_SPHS4|nr:hypothetical protein M422DRAFT_33035 [Sphaerobolus stellatus SS14]
MDILIRSADLMFLFLFLFREIWRWSSKKHANVLRTRSISANSPPVVQAVSCGGLAPELGYRFYEEQGSAAATAYQQNRDDSCR